jgi:hypothetical protein
MAAAREVVAISHAHHSGQLDRGALQGAQAHYSADRLANISCGRADETGKSDPARHCIGRDARKKSPSGEIWWARFLLFPFQSDSCASEALRAVLEPPLTVPAGTVPVCQRAPLSSYSYR